MKKKLKLRIFSTLNCILTVIPCYSSCSRLKSILFHSDFLVPTDAIFLEKLLQFNFVLEY